METDVASEPMRPEPVLAVAVWNAERDVREMYLTAVSAAGIRCGIAIEPAGKLRGNDCWSGKGPSGKVWLHVEGGLPQP